jgi:hypothetical protein
VSLVRYELGFYIPEDDILRSHLRENLKSFSPGLYLILLGNDTLTNFIFEFSNVKRAMAIFICGISKFFHILRDHGQPKR